MGDDRKSESFEENPSKFSGTKVQKSCNSIVPKMPKIPKMPKMPFFVPKFIQKCRVFAPLLLSPTIRPMASGGPQQLSICLGLTLLFQLDPWDAMLCPTELVDVSSWYKDRKTKFIRIPLMEGMIPKILGLLGCIILYTIINHGWTECFAVTATITPPSGRSTVLRPWVTMRCARHHKTHSHN